MTGVLADLALEYEGAVAGALRLSRAIEEAAAGDADAAAFRRIAAPVLKYWVCKRTPGPRRRGARMPGRQRLHGGVPAGPGLPGGAAHVGLGRVGQRAGARRPPGAAPTSPGWPTRCSASSSRPGAATACSTRRRRRWPTSWPPGSPTRGRPGPSSVWPPGRCALRCWSASPRRRWPTPSAPPGSAPASPAPTATCPPGRGGLHRGTGPPGVALRPPARSSGRSRRRRPAPPGRCRWRGRVAT